MYESDLSILKSIRSKVFNIGYKVVENKGTGILWMSVGNPYFNRENINRTIKFCTQKFERVLVLSPAKPTEYTFLALGYSRDKAKRKARLHSNRLKNHAQRSINELCASDGKVEIIKWNDEIVKNSVFIDYLRYLQNFIQ